MTGAWKTIIIMALLLVMGLSILVSVSQFNGDLEEGSLAYKVKMLKAMQKK